MKSPRDKGREPWPVLGKTAFQEHDITNQHMRLRRTQVGEPEELSRKTTEDGSVMDNVASVEKDKDHQIWSLRDHWSLPQLGAR